MNKTGFRGMYREGPNGYNIPYGNYKNPKILEEKELDYISQLIQNVNFIHSDFTESLNNIENENNFIYLDPPYATENEKSFVGYTKDGFDYKYEVVSCRRAINSKNPAAKTEEVIITNYLKE